MSQADAAGVGVEQLTLRMLVISRAADRTRHSSVSSGSGKLSLLKKETRAFRISSAIASARRCSASAWPTHSMTLSGLS